MPKKPTKLDLMFCDINLHIFLYILSTEKYSTYQLHALFVTLELELCTVLKCANTGHLINVLLK